MKFYTTSRYAGAQHFMQINDLKSMQEIVECKSNKIE